MRLHNAWKHPELSWVITIGIVFILALIDQFFIPSQGGRLGSLWDWSILCGALVGACCSWVVSYRAPLRTESAPNAPLTIRILLCWLFGPFLVVGAACLAPEIDGGLLLIYPPFFGLLLTIFVLPLLLSRRWVRLEKSNPKSIPPAT
jgi:hypothetical protein